MGQGSFNVVVVDGRPPPLLDDNLIFMALQLRDSRYLVMMMMCCIRYYIDTISSTIQFLIICVDK